MHPTDFSRGGGRDVKKVITFGEIMMRLSPPGFLRFQQAKSSTTQRYLGKVSDTEAMRWIDNL
jgi:hypothetical protein